MSTRQKTGKPNFVMVVLGLLLAIGLIIGGTFALSELGLLGPSGGTGAVSSGLATGTLPDGAFTGERPSRPEGMADDHNNGGSALIGFVKAIGQMALVITLVYYSQKLFGPLEKRWHKPKLTNQVV